MLTSLNNNIHRRLVKKYETCLPCLVKNYEKLEFFFDVLYKVVPIFSAYEQTQALFLIEAEILVVLLEQVFLYTFAL